MCGRLGLTGPDPDWQRHPADLALLVDHTAERRLDDDLPADRAADLRPLDDPAVPRSGGQCDLPGQPVRDVDLAHDRGLGQGVDVLPECLGGRDPVELLGGGVPDLDPRVEVGDDEGVGGGRGEDPEERQGRPLDGIGGGRRRSRVGFGHVRILRAGGVHGPSPV